jgi:hypothetical protein
VLDACSQIEILDAASLSVHRVFENLMLNFVTLKVIWVSSNAEHHFILTSNIKFDWLNTLSPFHHHVLVEVVDVSRVLHSNLKVLKLLYKFINARHLYFLFAFNQSSLLVLQCLFCFGFEVFIQY